MIPKSGNRFSEKIMRQQRIPRVPFLPPNDYLGSKAQAGPAWRPLLLNRYDRSSPINGEAEVKYLDGDFRVTRPGAFVRCALTGVSIPLEELKYWSVELQEAYASPQAVLQRQQEKRAK